MARIGTADNKRVLGALPTEGTVVRDVYDLLLANAGKPVAIMMNPKLRHNKSGTVGKSIETLKTYYGCDILYQHRRHTLIGEWKGKTYLSYEKTD